MNRSQVVASVIKDGLSGVLEELRGAVSSGYLDIQFLSVERVADDLPVLIQMASGFRVIDNNRCPYGKGGKVRHTNRDKIFLINVVTMILYVKSKVRVHAFTSYSGTLLLYYNHNMEFCQLDKTATKTLELRNFCYLV
ncbi:MAG: hypothetical protein ACK42D_00445 [Candidatus Paceibacteria bacterium]